VSGHDDRLVRRVVEAAAGRPGPDSCPDAELLGLYAERMLDDGERRGVEAHIVDCARCQAALAAFVRGAPAEDAVTGRDAAGEAGDTSDDPSRAPWWLGWKWLVPAAAMAAVVIVTVWAMRPARPELTMTSVEQAAPVSAPQAPATPPPGAPSTVGTVAPASEPAASRQTSREAGPAERPAAPPASGLADTRGRPSPGPAGSERRADSAVAAAAPARVAEAPAPLQAGEAMAARQRPEVPPAVGAASPATATAKAAADSAGGSAAGRRFRAETAAPRTANQGPRMTDLTGRVTYRTRQALPAGAVIEARLLDVSRADAPAEELGRVEIVTRGEQVPVPFALRYDASRVEPSRRYTVQVTITIDGRVRFRTTAAHAVLTNGAPATDVEVVVEPM